MAKPVKRRGRKVSPVMVGQIQALIRRLQRERVPAHNQNISYIVKAFTAITGKLLDHRVAKAVNRILTKWPNVDPMSVVYTGKADLENWKPLAVRLGVVPDPSEHTEKPTTKTPIVMPASTAPALGMNTTNYVAVAPGYLKFGSDMPLPLKLGTRVGISVAKGATWERRTDSSGNDTISVTGRVEIVLTDASTGTATIASVLHVK